MGYIPKKTVFLSKGANIRLFIGNVLSNNQSYNTAYVSNNQSYNVAYVNYHLDVNFLDYYNGSSYECVQSGPYALVDLKLMLVLQKTCYCVQYIEYSVFLKFL